MHMYKHVTHMQQINTNPQNPQNHLSKTVPNSAPNPIKIIKFNFSHYARTHTHTRTIHATIDDGHSLTSSGRNAQYATIIYYVLPIVT